MFNIPLPIERVYQEEKESLTVSTKEISNCSEKAKLYYANLFIKVYTYCLDDIYKVRITSAKVLATLIEYLYNINYKKEQLFKIIDSFAMHQKFQQRIIFVKMCKIFLNNKNLYEEKIKNILNI